MKPETNSQTAPPIDAVLAVNDGSESPLRRAGVNVSSTHISTGGVADVKLRVFDEMMTVLQSSDTKFNIDLEALDVHRTATALQDRASSIAEIDDLAACSPLERTRTLRGLATGHPSRASRKLGELAEAIVEENVSPIKQQVIHTAAAHPFHAEELGRRCREAIDLLSFPTITHTASRHLLNAQHALDAIKNKQSTVPPHLYEAITSALLQRTDKLADDTFASVCREYSATSLKRSHKEVRNLTTECERLGGEFKRQAEAIREVFDRERRRQHDSDAVSTSSVVIALPGPSESDLMANMISRQSLSGPAALAESMLGSLTVRLSAMAEESFPHVDHQAPIGALVTRLPADVTAEAFSEIIDRSIGNAHTVYSSTKSIGVAKLAGGLLDNADVLVNLGGHQHEHLHIQPIEQTLVRFPPRLGIGDEQTYLDLREAFSRLSAGCLFAEAGPGERDITCVRTLVGFPICVEDNNDCLLQANATCAPHPPYLFGLLSDDGQPPEAVLQLYQILSQE